MKNPFISTWQQQAPFQYWTTYVNCSFSKPPLKSEKKTFSKCAYHSKSEIYSFFSKNVCNTQFWSLVLAIEAMRDELHHLPDDDPGPTPKIKFGMVYLTIVFNMEFIKNLCCLRNSGMLIRHFMLAHLKVCRPFVMRVLVKNHGNRHT